MKKDRKNQRLQEARQHVEKTCLCIVDAIGALAKSVIKRKAELKHIHESDKLVFTRLLIHDEERLTELHHLQDSPYFAKCQIQKERSGEGDTWYFGKFSYTDLNIFSWVTPAASIRFENPGSFSFEQPSGKLEKVKLLEKDQYMIVDGKIIFLATESIDEGRTLIHQEHFSRQKIGFVLPEIVAQMEKAQDQVIRASHKGALVISGPAGSGKTTLAFHRIAYLVQSPETMEFFTSDSIIVFVQDEGTKDYFSHLLPELGIRNVQITTFAEWAMKVLGLEGVVYADRIGNGEEEKNAYEATKLAILKASQKNSYKYTKNIFNLLSEVYAPHMNDSQQALLSDQKKFMQLDRFDLTLLLDAFKSKHGELSTKRDYYLELNNGKLKKKNGRLPVRYSLVLVDEFQNYLPEQIVLMKGCKKEEGQSMLYVGDIAQQVQSGTMRDFSEINEVIADDALVALKKVYRNTKEILSFIKSLGYPVEVSNEVKDGKAVEEHVMQGKDEEIAYVKGLLKGISENMTIGVLSRHQEYLAEFEIAFKGDERVRVLDVKEAQGVEFDVVCMVGVEETTFRASDDQPEQQRILKNLLYIGLTRAMTELHILGTSKLKKFSY
jgi:DNA helicase IV